MSAPATIGEAVAGGPSAGTVSTMVKHTSGENIWQHRVEGRYVVIGTGTRLRPDGTAALTAGVAREAACRHNQLEGQYGRWLAQHSAVNPFSPEAAYINDDLGLILAPVCDAADNAALELLTIAAAAAADRGVDLAVSNNLCGCGRTRIEDLDELDTIFADVDLIVTSAAR